MKAKGLDPTLKVVIGVALIVALLFVSIPCCVSGFMFYKFRQQQAEKDAAEHQKLLERYRRRSQ